MKIKHNIIATILSAINLIAVNQVSALTYESDTNVDFTINPTISITVSGDLIIDNLTPGSSSDSNIIEVGVSTNASHGYYLSATVGSSSTDTNLTNSDNSNYTFTNLSSNASSLSSFNDNEWGYSYSTDGGTNWISGGQGSTTSGYNGLPLDNDDSGATGITLVNTTNPVANNSVKFKIGAKASNTQPSGTYTNTINFYAITHQAPLTFDDAFAAAGKTKYLGYYKMQDMTHDICVSAEQGLNTKLIDIRDNEIYIIAKLKDNNCWMLDNLRLGSNEFEINLSSLDTNLLNEYVLPKGVDTTAFQMGWTSGQINAAYKNQTTTNFGNGSGKIGTYYNFCATTAGTYCYSSNSGIDIPDTLADATQDICPLGWNIPTGGPNSHYQKLQQEYPQVQSAPNVNSLQYNLSTPLSGGYYYGKQDYLGQYGNFWSSTFYTVGSMYLLVVRWDTAQDTFNYYGREAGRSIRCLAK